MAFYIPARKNMRDSYRGVTRLHDDIDRLFEGIFPTARSVKGFLPDRDVEATEYIPQMDVTVDEQKYALHIELPGVAPEAVKIRIADGILSVSGEKKADVPEKSTVHLRERFYGAFTRSLSLPEDADPEGVRAFSKDGVLTVEIARKKPEEAKTRTIEVRRA